MYNIVYIADNDTDLMGIPIDGYSSSEEVSPEPDINNGTSEMSLIAGKLLSSFGALIICIVIFLVLVLFFKKRISSSQNVEEYAGMISEDETESKERNKTSDTLNTPANINECIRTFLENTRNL